MTIASLWTLFIPLYVLGAILLLFAALALLARVQNGRYVRPIVQALTRIAFLRRLLTRASRAAIEKQNPELASALQKLERAGVGRDPNPQKAQQAMSRLTAAERRAWLDAAQEQNAMPEAPNRAMRRQQQKLKKRR
jgi:hypothetical protein